MKDEKTYHHGDLRAALLVAAEAELIESGIEGFSLRKVARRAGVSHAAPAHHFGDVSGLLTALAAVGFRRLVELADRRAADAGPGTRDRLLAYGLAYCDFAREHLALFRLCFASQKPAGTDPDLVHWGTLAFDRLHAAVVALRGPVAEPGPVAEMADTYAVWAATHGLADLLATGRMRALADLPPRTRDAQIVALLSRMMPEG